MSKFEIKRISPQNSINTYFKLVKDDECLYDEFRDEINKGGNLRSDLARIGRYIQWDEEGKELPNGSIKPLHGRDRNDRVIDFEFRTNKLRLYFFREDNIGNIIVLGALNDKKKQKGGDGDIERMRRIKKEYIQWKTKVKE
jgi:hypothetical protein